MKNQYEIDYQQGYDIANDKWLERLDKMRAEVKKKIVKRPWLNFEDRERDRNDAFLEVLDIIDRYKTESRKQKTGSEEEC